MCLSYSGFCPESYAASINADSQCRLFLTQVSSNFHTDEDFGAEPTGIREHVNVPMEKVVPDNSDHLFPNYNTHIPDAPLSEDPTRLNRFGRFKQVFGGAMRRNTSNATCRCRRFKAP